LLQAATACGVNRSTVLRAIKAGEISASKDEQGEWHNAAVLLNSMSRHCSPRADTFSASSRVNRIFAA
jgi:hypothetical protein